jgi:hypothetical protein
VLCSPQLKENGEKKLNGSSLHTSLRVNEKEEFEDYAGMMMPFDCWPFFQVDGC